MLKTHSFTRLTLLASLLASLLYAVAPVPIAQAESITVNTNTDELNSDGDCSLREAVQAANTDAAVDACTAGSGADTIIVPAGTYTLTILPSAVPDTNADGDLDITSNIAISGAGASSTIIQPGLTPAGSRIDRVVHVNAAIAVDISGVTIANGQCPCSGAGAAVNNGGGMFAVSGSDLTITNSAFSGNIATASGGGVATAGTSTISNSTFSGNSAGGSGGGFATTDTSTITNSTFSGNSAGGNGGGIATTGTSTIAITNSTFSGNSANTGGGVFNLGTMTVTNSTFSANSASAGGGISNAGGGTVRNTIVANSTAVGNCDGAITDGGNNLQFGGTVANSCGAGIPTADPQLGDLTGSSQYFPLNTGSAAIDAGSNTVCAAAPVNNTSQNGVTRPADGDGNGTATCDIGSYEAPAVPAASSACILSATFTGSVTVSGGNPYYLNCFFGQVYVDNGEGRATGGNHYQGNVTITANGAAVCIQVPAGFTAASPTCVTDSGGGRKDFGIRPIAQPSSQTTTGAQSVGASGGMFPCGSSWTLTIPADVLPNNSSLQCGAFDPNVTTGAPTGFKFMGQMINVLILDNTGAARHTFNPPLTVCITYADADVLAAGGDPNNFVIQTADIGGAWTTMTTTVNTSTRQVCASTDHLTLFEVAAKVPTSLPVTGQNFTPFIIAALIFALAIVAAGVLVRHLKT